MTTPAFKQTWTALEGKLIFDFTMYRSEEHGASIVRVHLEGYRKQPVHEVLLPSDDTRQFSFTTQSMVYVKGTLRRESKDHGDGNTHIYVFADVFYGQEGRHDDHHFIGFMIAINCHDAPSASEPVTPPPPPPLDAHDSTPCLAETESTPQATMNTADDDLLPYGEVRTSPAGGADALRFISYAPAADLPGNTLYQALLAARPAGRVAMEALVLRYINGEGPWEPAFPGLTGDLPALWHGYADVATAAQQLCSQPERLRQRIFTLLDAETDEQVAARLASPAFRDATTAAWQSYFALTIMPVYDKVMLSTLSRFLGAAHLLNHLYLSAPPSPPSAATLTALAHASIVLPAAIFPLPAAASTTPCAANVKR